MILSETLSDVPNGWACATLDSVTSGLYRYPTFYGMERLDEGVPVIRGEHIKSNGTISHEWLDYWYVSEEISAKFPRTILQPGDLVMSVRGTIGKMGLVDKKLHAAQISPNCLRIVLPRSSCVPEYILHYLKSAEGQAAIQRITNSTTIRTIKASLLAKVPIPLAPLPEQRRIVEKIEELFTKLDAGVRSLGQAREQFKSYRRSVLKAAVEGELSREWREAHRDELEPASELLERVLQERREEFEGKTYKEPATADTAGLPKLPETWCWTSLSSIADMQLGKMLSRAAKTGSGSRPYLRNQNVRWGSIDTSDVLMMDFDEREVEKFTLVRGDVLVCEGGEPGRAAVWAEQLPGAMYQKALHRVRIIGSALMPEYVVYHLRKDASGGALERYFTGSTIKHFTGVALAKYAVSLPPLEEQRFIVEEVERRLSVVDKLEATAEENLRQAESLRQSIFKRAFSGELVSQDPDDEPASVLLERIRREREDRKPSKKKQSRRPTAPKNVKELSLFPEE